MHQFERDTRLQLERIEIVEVGDAAGHRHHDLDRLTVIPGGRRNSGIDI